MRFAILILVLLAGCTPQPATPQRTAIDAYQEEKAARDVARWKSENQKRRTNLSAEARNLLTEKEIDAIASGPPEPGYGFNPERENVRLKAMQKVVEADVGFATATRAMRDKMREMCSVLVNADPNAEVVGRSVSRQMGSEIEAVVRAREAVYSNNGWEPDGLSTRLRDALFETTTASATDLVLVFRAQMPAAKP